MHLFAFRLHPGQDLKDSLADWTAKSNIQAGFILTAVGSLTVATLRFAGGDEAQRLEGRFEIVSLVGTLSPDGLHLHMAIADGAGRVVGGHVMSGCRIYTTAEIVVGDAETFAFRRGVDSETGYKELQVVERSPDILR
jgi:predicted DNA-binding protein with PD1-like motif